MGLGVNHSERIKDRRKTEVDCQKNLLGFEGIVTFCLLKISNNQQETSSINRFSDDTRSIGFVSQSYSKAERR